MRPCPHRRRGIARRVAASTAIFTAGMLAALALVAAPAHAQQADPVGQGAAVGGVGESELRSMQATIETIDFESRKVTLVGPAGETVTIKASDEVRNLDQVQPGDTVVVRYYDSLVYVIAPGGHSAPDDMAVTATARAAPGALPGAAVAERIIVTGVVVGVDTAANTISLVDPAGGKVRTLEVRKEQNQEMLGLVNVGDTVTAYLTEAVAIAVEPTR